MCDRESEIIIQHLNPLSATGLTLKDWPEANWQSLIFGKRDKCFHTSQTIKKKITFYCHFLRRRARGVFSVPIALAEKFWSFSHWLKNGGVLRGSGTGGLRVCPVSWHHIPPICGKPAPAGRHQDRAGRLEVNQV